MWTRDSTVINDTDQYTVEVSPLVDEENAYFTSLTIAQVTPQEAGTYKVAAQNEEGEANVSVSLLVKSKFLMLFLVK